tara:strand:- start:274 stop:1230 length:957 start_codon:yes stop_codon:yes gene_type:complete
MTTAAVPIDTVSIDVVMPTYNGAAYLGAQLSSLQHQTHMPRRVVICDDGSSDSTGLILRRWQKSWSAIDLVETDQPQQGATRRFHHLLTTVAGRGDLPDLLAFCDQDDEWFEDKLERAAAWHRQQDAAVPALYCSAAVLTDQRMVPVGQSPKWRREPAFRNALVENIALGCTIVLNRAALELLNRDWPRGVIAHDWWAYLVVSGAGGQVYFDPEPSLNYRQHNRNAIGMAHSALGQLIGRIRRIATGQMPPLLAQARGLADAYGDDLTPEARQQLDRFINVQKTTGNRLTALVAPVVRRQRLIDNLVLRLMLAFGTLR